MSLSHLIMINNELLNKYPNVFPEQAHMIILDSKSAIYMDKNDKDTEHTRNINEAV